MRVLPGQQHVEYHHWESADVSGSLYWEERYWLDFMLVRDHRRYRDREKRRSYIEDAQRDWALEDTSWSRPSKPDDTHLKTLIMNTQMLLAWLYTKLRHFARQGCRGIGPCKQAIQYLLDLVSAGFEFASELPGMDIGGFSLAITPAGFRVDELIHLFPTLLSDWHDLTHSHMATTAGLDPLREHGSVALGQMLTFLEARAFYSSLPQGHWLLSMRNALLRLVCRFIEGAIIGHNLRDPLRDQLVPGQLVGKSRKRKLARGRTAKYQLLKNSIKRCGAGNSVMDVLASGHRGFAHKVRNVGNASYIELSRDCMRSSTAAALHWDGAMYGGLNINVAIAVDPISGFACHLQPIVP